jgi:3-hydroxymyristoyl/3-hydroxydecanoyl-(acyl carrier protein) dehydratase
VAVKAVTMNEPFFQGHFPGTPVMPGVLQVEAMAQAGAILLLLEEQKNPDGVKRIPFFMSLDKVKFRRPVAPGDLLRIEVDVLRYRSRMAACMARTFVDNHLCCEAEIRSVMLER